MTETSRICGCKVWVLSQIIHLLSLNRNIWLEKAETKHFCLFEHFFFDFSWCIMKIPSFSICAAKDGFLSFIYLTNTSYTRQLFSCFSYDVVYSNWLTMDKFWQIKKELITVRRSFFLFFFFLEPVFLQVLLF